MFGLDFSYARPGGAALAAAGVSSVGRYLATDGRGITPNELNDYLTNGVTVWFTKENAANGMLGGSAQGIRDATAAQTQLNTLGQPNAAVYYAVDFDAQPSQFGALDAYLQGVATIMPVSRIGIYAGIDYMNHAANLASYYWKTASSSFDHNKTANMQLHLIQTLNAVPILNTDYDIIVQANHGQIGTTGTAPADTNKTPLTPQPKEDEMVTLVKATDGPANWGVIVGNTKTIFPGNSVGAAAVRGWTKIAALQQGVDITAVKTVSLSGEEFIAVFG